MKIHIHGEDSIIVYFDTTPSPKTLAKIISYKKLLQENLGDIYKYSIPSYVSLVVFYDIGKINANSILDLLTKLGKKTLKINNFTPKIHKIPIIYNYEYGLDLENILKKTSLKLAEFIKLHAKTYDIYSVGFLPNFAYLGNVEKSICLPRLKTPRQNICKGSVGIAGCQTGIYPQNSHAGWNIVGKTYVDLSNEEFKFCVGDKIEFFQSGG